MTATTKPPLDVLRARLQGTYVVDEWGYDRDFVDLLDPFLSLAYQVDVAGADHIPDEGPLVLVANRRLGFSEPVVIARGIRRATGRRVRFVGIPDVPVLGPALRRIGGAIAKPAEIASLLRADQAVVLPLTRRLYPRRVAGDLDPEVLVPVLELGVPVLPLALVGRQFLPTWHVFVGEPIEPPQVTGPLGLAEMAERVEGGVQGLLDEAFPPRWLLG